MIKNLSFIVLTIVLVSCGSNFTAFEYTSTNQSGEFSVKVNKDSISYFRTGDVGKASSAPIDKKSWKKLTKAASSITLEALDTLSSPSNKRATDQASSAYLTFYLKDTVYQSASFDGMNPNIMLREFNDSLFRLTSVLK